MTLVWSSVVPIVDAENVEKFETGLNSVDSWFRQNAQAEHAAGRVRTHCCITEKYGFTAFYALKMITVVFEGASNAAKKKYSAVDGSSTGLLLAQMGVRADLQGLGFGSNAVWHALRTAVKIHEQASFAVLIVDAENDGLIPYYEKFGFTALRGDRRLIMKMSTVRRIVETRGLL